MTSHGKSIFSSLKTAAKKAPHPSSKDDHSLSNAIAAVHIENSRILSCVDRLIKDESGIEYPEKDQETHDNRQDASDVVQVIPRELTAIELALQDSPVRSVSSSTAAILPYEVGFTNHSSNEGSMSILFPAERPRATFFLRNLSKPTVRIELPEAGYCFSSTLQLVSGHRLLFKELPPLSSTPGSLATT